MGWARRIAWGTLLLLGLVSVWRRRQGHPLVQPPLCAWRFVSNFKSYNLAFPDSNSIYHVSLMHLGPGDELRISSDAMPYARYFSFQTYTIPDLLAKASVRDVDMVTEGGPNCYANLTAAVNGEKQGGYTLYITARGNQGYVNELRALPDGKEAGYFVLFLRIYQDAADAPPHPSIDPSVCFGPKGRHPGETPQEWGWACPPEVAVKRGAASDWRALPFCRYRRKFGLRYNDVTTPVQECPHNPNTPFSFFLPSPFYLHGKFGNKDAKYLFSCAKQPLSLHQPPASNHPSPPSCPLPSATDGSSSSSSSSSKRIEEPPVASAPASAPASTGALELWARVTGVLPITANSLYSPPYVSNVSDYQVRYVSLSSVGRSLPYRGYETLNDRAIEKHYLESVGPSWDRSFVVWMGPPDVRRFPAEVERDRGLFLPWGRSFGGKQVPFPGVLYRQILSRGQVAGAETGEPFSLAHIIPDTCRAEEEEGAGSSDGGAPVCREGDDLGCWLERNLCCGSKAPQWCYSPRYLANKMRSFYPRVEYFYRRNSTQAQESLPLEPVGGQSASLRPLVAEKTAEAEADAEAPASWWARLWS